MIDHSLLRMKLRRKFGAVLTPCIFCLWSSQLAVLKDVLATLFHGEAGESMT